MPREASTRCRASTPCPDGAAHRATRRASKPCRHPHHRAPRARNGAVPMKIRVLSDLHLECDEPDVIPHAAADLIVLAGDIHNHAQGLRWAAETFDGTVPVVYVPGNHEYYDSEFGAMEA